MTPKPYLTFLRSSCLARIIGLCCLGLFAVLMLYIYHEGLWRQTLHYYRYFFDLRRLCSFIASFGPHAAVVFIVLQILQVVVAPIPGELTGFVGGLLFGKIGGTIYSTIGLTLGSLAAFGIARRLGSNFVHKIVKKEYIDRFDYFVTHRGLYIAYILFLIPGFPKDSLCYLLGLTRLRLLDFVFMNLFGRLPGTLILGLQGDAVRHKQYVAFWILLLSSILLVAVMYITRNYLIVAFHNIWTSIRRRRRTFCKKRRSAKIGKKSKNQ